MAKVIYAGANGVASKIKKLYAGANGVANAVKKVYVGVNGQATLAWAAQSGNYAFAMIQQGSGHFSSATTGVYKSSDLASFTANQVSSSTGVSDATLVYGNGKYVLGSVKKGSVFYSEDGVTWTEVQPTTAYQFSGVTYSVFFFDNKFWATTSYSTQWGGAAVFQSSDGVTWTMVAVNLGSAGERYIEDLCYCDGKYYMIMSDGELRYTSDWSVFTTLISVYSTKYCTAMFVHNNYLYYLWRSGDYSVCSTTKYSSMGMYDQQKLGVWQGTFFTDGTDVYVIMADKYAYSSWKIYKITDSGSTIYRNRILSSKSLDFNFSADYIDGKVMGIQQGYNSSNPHKFIYMEGLSGDVTVVNLPTLVDNTAHYTKVIKGGN